MSSPKKSSEGVDEWYLSFSTRPIPGKGEKSTIDGVIRGDQDFIAEQVLGIMERVPPKTPKHRLPAFANALFEDNHKIGSNWRSVSILHVDIDSGLPPDAHQRLMEAPFDLFWYQTPSSRPDHLKMRVYAFLDRELVNRDQYVGNYDHNCQELLKSCAIHAESDRQTKDAARFMYIPPRPETFGRTHGRKLLSWAEAPRFNSLGNPTANYKSAPTSQLFAGAWTSESSKRIMTALMRAFWVDSVRKFQWTEGEKHIDLLKLASKASGYSVPHETCEAELLKVLPSTVNSWEHAKATITYGYERPRFPDFKEMEEFTKSYISMKSRIKSARRLA